MESATEIIEKVHLVAGVLLTFLLLYVIRKFTKKSLGSYKQLLTIFASFDIFLIILHAAAKPKVVVIGTTFGVWCAFEDRVLTSFYCGCFTVPFALMIIHFVYRFWSIRHPQLIPLFSNMKFIAAVSCYPETALVSWTLIGIYGTTGDGEDTGKSLIQAESRSRYGEEMIEGWLVMYHWVRLTENGHFKSQVFVCLVSVDLIMAVSFSVAFILAGLTYHHIKRADTISFQSNSMQRKLLIAVCAQTFVPLVFVYIPYSCVLNFPFLRLPIFIMDDACMKLTSCFPAWDAVIMITLMKDYRLGLLKMMKKKETAHPTTVWQTNLSAIPSTTTTASTITPVS